MANAGDGAVGSGQRAEPRGPNDQAKCKCWTVLVSDGEASIADFSGERACKPDGTFSA